MTTTPVTAGCDWPIDEGCLVGWEDLDSEVQERAVTFASATLRRLTGYRVGGCPITVRPCKRGCVDLMVTPSLYDMLSFGGGTGFWPHINTEGFWVNSCGCQTDCACTSLCEVELPGPVYDVSIMLDGATVPDTDYRVDGNLVVWIGEGDCPWPTCQDMTVANNAVGAFSITYLNAYPVDTLGAYAAGVMANEFAKACSGAKCRLPANVTAVTRQGVSIEIAAGSFPGGMTGIREVDAYIGLWNPAGARQASQVWTPDRRTPRVVGS